MMMWGLNYARVRRCPPRAVTEYHHQAMLVVRCELGEPVLIPNELKQDLRLKQTEKIIEFAKGYLGKYWKCLVPY